MNISFIGFGHMAKAMAQGLLKDNLQIRASAPSLTIGTNAQGIQTYANNLAIIPDADVVILAVKPKEIPKVYQEISTQLPDHCLVISVATGIHLSWFAKYTPKIAIIRAMPNIASAIGQGATPLIANDYCNEEQKKWAFALFSGLGLSTWVEKEEQIDAFTALSGSGPAYVFLFMEAMRKAAISLGISEEIATSFTLQTVHGALNLAINSSRSLDELRQTVTSPGGTTAAAITVFKELHFEAAIFAAMKAAYEKAKDLGKQYED